MAGSRIGNFCPKLYHSCKMKIFKKEKFEFNGYLFDSEDAALAHIAEKERIQEITSSNFGLISAYPYDYIPVEWSENVDIISNVDNYDGVVCLLSGELLRYVKEKIKILEPQEFMAKFKEDNFYIRAANFSDTIRALRDINQRAGGDWRELVEMIAKLEIVPEIHYTD